MVTLNKWDYKYEWESAAAQVENLIDVIGKNSYHIQELYVDLKKKDETINKLLARINEKREENYKLQSIIKSQSEKNLAEYHFPESVDN